MIRKTLLLILSLALLAGCQSKKGKWSETDLDAPDSLELAADIQISEEALEEIVQNERSIVHITDEQMKSIIRITEEVRNQLIEI